MVSITDRKRDAIIRAIENGEGTHKIAKRLRLTVQQVAAIRAHWTMGTYDELIGRIL